jgi:copper/silver efflux system protein
MPIKARIDMLSTGIRTPIGIKVFGRDLAEMEAARRRSRRWCAGARHHQRLRRAHHRRLLPRHRAGPRAAGALRLSVGEVQEVIATALGGEMVTTTVEGRERFGVSVRYPRDCATRPAASPRRCWCRRRMGGRHDAARAGRPHPASQGRAGDPHRERAAVGLHLRRHPRPRHRLLRGEAQKAVADRCSFPPATYATWSGQFEYMERAIER